MGNKVKFTIEILCIVMAAVFCMFMLEKLSEKEVLDADRLYSAISQSKLNKKLLIIGNSHSGNYNRTEMLGYSIDSILNLSIGGQDLFHGYLLAEKALSVHSEIECLLLSLDYDMMGYTLSGTNQKYMDRQYYIYSDTMQDMSMSNRFMAKSSFFRCNRHFQMPWKRTVAKKSSPMDANTQVSNFVPIESTDVYDSVFCKKRAWEMTMIKFDYRTIADNKNTLKAYITLCHRHNVRLVIVVPPKSPLFYLYVHQGNTLLGKQAIEEVLRESPEVVYFDFYQDSSFGYDMFLDADHLTMPGICNMVELMNSK